MSDDEPTPLRDDPAQPEALRALLRRASAPVPPEPTGAARLDRALRPGVPPAAIVAGMTLLALAALVLWRWLPAPESPRSAPAAPRPTEITAPEPAPTTTAPPPPEASSEPSTMAPDPPAVLHPPAERRRPACEDDAAAVETRLVAEADGLIARDPRAAGALLDRLDREVPTSCGFLSVEREGLRVLSLAGAGRTAEARRRAARFLLAHPEGRLARRIREALPE